MAISGIEVAILICINTMHIKFLGTGTSTGVPEIGCKCRVCVSSDKRDKRLRSSVMVFTGDKRILIDCGPDFRQQMLDAEFLSIDGLLITHEHYDHVGGIDDLRPFSRVEDVQVYAEGNVADALMSRIPYSFTDHKYPGVPRISMNRIDLNPFDVNGVRIIPIRLMHGNLPIFGYRIENFAYLTDVKHIPDEEHDKLRDLDVLVIDALRMKEHISHQSLNEALAEIEKIGAKRSYLIHMSHDFGLHAEMESKLPQNVFIAYDGLEVELP